MRRRPVAWHSHVVAEHELGSQRDAARHRGGVFRDISSGNNGDPQAQGLGRLHRIGQPGRNALAQGPGHSVGRQQFGSRINLTSADKKRGRLTCDRANSRSHESRQLEDADPALPAGNEWERASTFSPGRLSFFIQSEHAEEYGFSHDTEKRNTSWPHLPTRPTTPIPKCVTAVPSSRAAARSEPAEVVPGRGSWASSCFC